MEIHQCFCTGPATGEKLCPCQKRDQDNYYSSMATALEMQKNLTHAYMRDYEREKARADQLEKELEHLYFVLSYNG